MSKPCHELTLCVTVNSFQSASSGKLLFAVELRRETCVTQLEAFDKPELAEAYARVVARKLSRLIDAGVEMLED